MDVSILPYSVEHYNELPELMHAKESFDTSNALDIISGEIAQLSKKYGVEKDLGAIMLHNRFFLGPDEKLVKTGNVAVPWNMQSGSEEWANVVPSSWRFTDEGLMPYEFAHGVPVTAMNQAFLGELRSVLEKRKLENVVGISALDEEYWNKNGFMEFTSGRANVTLPFDLLPNEGGAIDALWDFAGNNRYRQ